jgi:hypothetical protein
MSRGVGRSRGAGGARLLISRVDSGVAAACSCLLPPRRSGHLLCGPVGWASSPCWGECSRARRSETGRVREPQRVGVEPQELGDDRQQRRRSRPRSAARSACGRTSPSGNPCSSRLSLAANPGRAVAWGRRRPSSASSGRKAVSTVSRTRRRPPGPRRWCTRREGGVAGALDQGRVHERRGPSEQCAGHAVGDLMLSG